jgi:hypothetical protein
VLFNSGKFLPSGGGVDVFGIFYAQKMEKLARYYEPIEKQKLMACVNNISKHFQLSERAIEDILVEHAIENMHIDGVACYYKLQSADKVFYIFGEYHRNDYTCEWNIPRVGFADILRAFLERNKNQVDVFFELKFLDPGEYTTTDSYTFTRWKRILNVFGECLQRTKTDCPYDNVRFHYADFRTTRAKPIDFYHGILLGKLVVGLLNAKSFTPQKKMAQEILDVLKTTRHTFPQAKKEILAVPKLKKQLDNIQDQTIAEKITQWFDLDKLARAWMDIVPLLEIFARASTPNAQVIEKLKQGPHLANKIVLLTGYIMDIYLMGRAFRQFRHVPGKHSQDPQTIFIYAGKKHAKRYKNFLVQELDFRLAESNKVTVSKKTDACIPLAQQFKILNL